MILKIESFKIRNEYIRDSGMNLQMISVINTEKTLANNNPDNVWVLICNNISNGISKICIIMANEYVKK